MRHLPTEVKGDTVVCDSNKSVRKMNDSALPDVSKLLPKHFSVDYRQHDALQKLDQKFPNTRLFAFESPRFKPSCRKFITEDIRNFYLWVSIYYRLYFDLEYYKEFNEDVNAQVMMDNFLDLCCRCLFDMLGIEMDRNKSFLVLNSSTESKFSAHVIVHLPGTRLFPSNLALKPVIKRICHQMLIENVGMMKQEDGKPKFVCDLSVYSRNRNFRLFLSSKCGKDAILKLAEGCAFYNDASKTSNAQIFLDSLVVPKDYNLYDVIQVPDFSLPVEFAEDLPASVPSTLQLDPGSYGNSAVYNLQSGRGPSPYPELDSHMLKVFKNLNPAAEIRLWRLIVCKAGSERIIQYQLNKSRYCYNKKREHKSQNVYWSVYLDDLYYVQQCFDVVDCPRFSSERFPVPEEVAEKIAPKIDVVFHQLSQGIIPSEAI
uniref:DNA-directed primase/polymerase protein n=1 Tax=Ditylenchus dipsaci TaxID=166011 RepID=A0A915D5V9_9BILA